MHQPGARTHGADDLLGTGAHQHNGVMSSIGNQLLVCLDGQELGLEPGEQKSKGVAHATSLTFVHDDEAAAHT